MTPSITSIRIPNKCDYVVLFASIEETEVHGSSKGVKNSLQSDKVIWLWVHDNLERKVRAYRIFGRMRVAAYMIDSTIARWC